MAISKQQPMREAEIAFINALDNGDFVERDELETIKQELESDVDSKIEKILPIETDEIADKAVTKAKIGDDVTFDVADGSITTNKIANEAVTSEKLAKLAVNEDNLNLQSVSSIKLKDGAVTTAKIGNVAVTNAKIATDAVNTTNIINGAVTVDKISNWSVERSKIKDYAIDSYKLDSKCVTIDKLANNSVTYDKLGSSLKSLIDFLETLPNIQFDYSPESYTISANSTLTVSITFASELTTTPSVFVDTQANVDGMIYSSVKSVTTTGFDVILKNDSDSEVSNITFDYLVLSAR